MTLPLLKRVGVMPHKRILGFVRVNQLEEDRDDTWPPAMQNPFRYFNSSPGVIRLAVMMYIHYPLSLRQGGDLLFERGIDICHETVRYPDARHRTH